MVSIADPNGVLPGHNMKAFSGIASAKERARIVAYLEAEPDGEYPALAAVVDGDDRDPRGRGPMRTARLVRAAARACRPNSERPSGGKRASRCDRR